MYTQRIINQIIKRRKELGITQSELGRLSSLPQSTIARIETLKISPTIDTLMKIAAPLSLDISFIDNSTIETERLILRKFRLSDASDMFCGYCSDEEVTKFLSWNPHKSIDETKYLLESWAKDYSNPNTIKYAITLKENGKLIGAIDVVRYIDSIPEVGYALSREYWNNGYMTEACTALRDYLIKIGFKKIYLRAYTTNERSNRVIVKCGFKYTGQIDMYESKLKTNVRVNCYEYNA